MPEDKKVDTKKEAQKEELRAEIKKEESGIPPNAVSMNTVTKLTPAIPDNAGDAPQPPPQLMQSIEGPEVRNERITGSRYDEKLKKVVPTYENDHKRRRQLDPKKLAEQQAKKFSEGVAKHQVEQKKQVDSFNK
jgi:hypothetical protein